MIYARAEGMYPRKDKLRIQISLEKVWFSPPTSEKFDG